MNREDQLRAAIATLPRIPLGIHPTPLEHLPRLSTALGGPPVYMKRDDLTGLAFGGNKTRMLEFSLADAQAKGADTIVTGMAVQSNYCRQMAAACAKTGLACHLVLRPVRPVDREVVQGNNLLQRLFGAHIDVLPDNDYDAQAAAVVAKADELRAAGKRVYVPRRKDTVDLDAIAALMQLRRERPAHDGEREEDPGCEYTGAPDSGSDREPRPHTPTNIDWEPTPLVRVVRYEPLEELATLAPAPERYSDAELDGKPLEKDKPAPRPLIATEAELVPALRALLLASTSSRRVDAAIDLVVDLAGRWNDTFAPLDQPERVVDTRRL